MLQNIYLDDRRKNDLFKQLPGIHTTPLSIKDSIKWIDCKIIKYELINYIISWLPSILIPSIPDVD